MCPPAAVLFWLNYKAAYDNWNEQRLALNKDIHMATKEVVDKLPGIQQTSVQAFSTLFLQLTVNDLGICLPITGTSQVMLMPIIVITNSQYYTAVTFYAEGCILLFVITERNKPESSRFAVCWLEGHSIKMITFSWSLIFCIAHKF